MSLPEGQAAIYSCLLSSRRAKNGWLHGKRPVKPGPRRWGEGKENWKLNLMGNPMDRESSWMFLWSTGGKQSTQSTGHGVRGLKSCLKGCSWPRKSSLMIMKTRVLASKPTANVRVLYPHVLSIIFHREKNHQGLRKDDEQRSLSMVESTGQQSSIQNKLYKTISNRFWRAPPELWWLYKSECKANG